MPLPPQLRWLRRKFDPLSIVYLDSLVCEMASTNIWLSRLTPGQSPAQKFASLLAGKLRIKATEKTVANYLDPKGLGTRFKKDRNLQHEVAKVIEDSITGDSNLIRRYEGLDRFYRERNSLLSDDSAPEVLVALDTMFACRLSLPNDLKLALPEKVEADPRYVECALIDEHPKLLTLYDRHVVLSVDRRAFYEWTEEFTRILTVGWHPFTRTIGYYTTSASGQPFVRVLAILMQPYPSLSEVLLPRRAEPANENLHAVLASNLATIQQWMQIHPAAAPPTASSAGGPAPTNTPPPAPAASSASGPAPSNTPSPASVTASAGGPAPTSTPPPAAAGSSTSASTPPVPPSSPAIAAGGQLTPAPPESPTVGRPPGPVAGTAIPANVTHGSPTPPAAQASATSGTAASQPAGPPAAGGSPSSSGGTGPQAGSAAARSSGGTASTPAALTQLTFRDYRRLIYPVYVVQTLCGLNGISGTGLRGRAKPTYDLLEKYLEQLQNLHDLKQYLSPQVLVMAPPDGIETLLEEPKVSEGLELAIYE